jgi:hypothetical protein
LRGRERERGGVVVLHQRHVGQVEPLEQLAHHAPEALEAQVGIAPHRPPVRAQWQRRHDAAVLVAELGDERVPHRAVHH